MRFPARLSATNATKPIDLPGVTLCCVDTRTPDLALEALARSQRGLRFGDVLLFTDRRLRAAWPTDVRVVDTRIDSSAAYSAFMLKELLHHVHTPHLLIVQWDGYVLRPQAWDPGFLDWDYIGAPWPWFQGQLGVGNGGFSLRSRKLLQALADPAFVASHPEDLCICHVNRQRLEREHGIRFAPQEVAERFGFERGTPSGPTFGFHGLFNFHRVMGVEALRIFLNKLPPALAAGRDGKDLCKALIHDGEIGNAWLLVRKRIRTLGLRDAHTLRLALRLAWAWLHRAPSSHA